MTDSPSHLSEALLECHSCLMSVLNPSSCFAVSDSTRHHRELFQLLSSYEQRSLRLPPSEARGTSKVTRLLKEISEPRSPEGLRTVPRLGGL